MRRDPRRDELSINGLPSARNKIEKYAMLAKTASFVAEFPLRTTQADERALAIRLEAARHIYNAALGEALRRLGLMRESKAWQAARLMPPGAPESAERKARSDAFKPCIRRFKFGWRDLQAFTKDCRNRCWIKDHLGSQECQAVTRRAFQVVEQYGFGKRRRPRFKRMGSLNSVENQCNSQGLRFKHGMVIWTPGNGGKTLRIPIMRDPRDLDRYQDRALATRIKYPRIVRREVRGRVRWYGQLVLDGTAPERRMTGDGAVGLDIGPSTVAIAGDAAAALEGFCPSVEQPWREMRCIERAMDRSKRATNPDCFNADGTWKRGARAVNRSRRYQVLAQKRRDRERHLAAERKRAHGELANRILGQGTEIHLEKLSYRAFQKRYGRSVKVRAPGAFVALLGRKARETGGGLIEISTRKTCLSQIDHTTGEYVKKPLSQRIHHFGDGITAPVQRDLYSAFLARHCGPETLDIRQAIEAWPGAEPLLRRAMSGDLQFASGCGLPLPRAIYRAGADRPSKPDGRPDEAGDAVARARAPENPANCTGRTTYPGEYHYGATP